MTKSFLKVNRQNREHGLAILETACFMVVLLLLIIGAIGLVFYLQDVRAVKAAVDRNLYDDAVKPLTTDQSSLSFQVRVNREELERYIQEAVRKARTDLRSHRGFSEENLFIEAKFAELAIDTTSGQPESSPQTVGTEQFGSAAVVTGDALSKTDLEESFSHRGDMLQSDGSSFWASPLPVGETERFAPTAVLAGLRAFVRVNGIYGWILENVLQLDPVIFEAKVVTLRGDLDV